MKKALNLSAIGTAAKKAVEKAKTRPASQPAGKPTTKEAPKPSSESEPETPAASPARERLQAEPATKRDREASRELTRTQAETASSLTGGPTSGDGETTPAIFRFAGDEVGDVADSQDSPDTDEAQEARQTEETEANPELQAAQEALDEHITVNDEGEVEIDAAALSGEVARRLEENPELAAELLEANPEAFEQLGRQLPELEDQQASDFYGSLIESAEALPQGRNEDLAAITDFITNNPEAVADPRFQAEVARQSVVSGHSRLGGNVAAGLDTDHPQRQTVVEAANAGQHADFIRERASGTPEQLQEVAARLNELSNELPPSVIQGLVQGLGPQEQQAPVSGPFLEPPAADVDQGVLGDLLSNALSLPTEPARPGQDPAPPAATVALLHGLSEFSSAAQNPATTERVADALAATVNQLSPPVDPDANPFLVGVFPTAAVNPLGRTLGDSFKAVIAAGGDANLGVALLDRLQERPPVPSSLLNPNLSGGPDSIVTSLSTGLTDGIGQYNANFAQAREDVADFERDLSYLTLNYGPFMTDEELAAAVTEFRSNHSEFQTFDAYADAALPNVEALDRLSEIQQDLGLTQHHQATELQRGSTLANATDALNSPEAREQLEGLIMREAHGEETFLSNLEDRFGDSEEAQAMLDKFRSTQFDVAFGSASEAAANGQTRTAQMMLDGFQASGGMNGIPVDQSEQVVNNLRTIVEAAGSGDSTAVADAQEELSEVLDELETPDGPRFANLSAKLRLAGGALGVAGLIAKGSMTLDDPSLQNVIDLAATGTGLGADLFESQLSKIFSPSSVRLAGNIAGGIGAALSAFDAYQSFADGDASQGALNLTSALGGVLALAPGAAATGIGAALVIGSAIGTVALAQYRKVQASNRYESDDTKNFIRHALNDATLSDSESSVLSELNNADSEGRLTGVLIQQTAAELGIPPNELFNQIAGLSADDIHTIVTEGHGVDPRDDNDITSLSPQQVEEFADFLQQRFEIGT